MKWSGPVSPKMTLMFVVTLLVFGSAGAWRVMHPCKRWGPPHKVQSVYCWAHVGVVCTIPEVVEREVQDCEER